MIAICMSLSDSKFLISCLFGYSPRTFMCIMLISLISLSSFNQPSIFCYLSFLICCVWFNCLCFHLWLSLECWLIHSLISFFPHCILNKVANDSLVINSYVIPIHSRVSSNCLVPLFFSVACHVSLWFRRFCYLGIHLMLNYFCHRFLVATTHSIRICG